MISNSQPKDVLSILKDAVTLLGSVGAISYAAGFIIVRTYLLQYGISDLSLLAPRYVSVGLFFFIITGLILVPAYFAEYNIPQEIRLGHAILLRSIVKNLESLNPKIVLATLTQPLTVVLIQVKQFESIKRIRWVEIYTAVVTLAFLSHIFLLLISAPSWQSQALFDTLFTPSKVVAVGDQFSQRLQSLLLGWYIPVCLASFLLSRVVSRKPLGRDLLGIPNRFSLIGIIVLFFVIAIRTYASEIYPTITPALGGGDIVKIQLVAEKAKVETLGQLVPIGKKSPKTSFTSAPLWLLDQSDKNYFILVCDNGNCDTPPKPGDTSVHAVQLDKGLIQGVIYLAKKPQDFTVRP